MTFSKVLFIGLGGAGQRHLRILRQLLPEKTVFSAFRRHGKTPLLNADFSVRNETTIEAAYGLKLFDTMAAAFADGPDLTVISTPTAHHREPMMLAMQSNSGVFVEKPWAESLEGFDRFRLGMTARKLPFHISFQRRFHPLIKRAREAVAAGKIGRPIAASFTVFSHVPSWHPYENWRDLYAVRADLGGGVLLTEIHEIDLANWFFGLPSAVFCAGGNRSAEALRVEDTTQLTLLYDNFSVQITLCFLHKQTYRGFHIAGTNGDIAWDLSGNKLSINAFGSESETDADPAYPNDAMFTEQAKRFVFDWDKSETQSSLDAAEGSLAIIDAARRSMHSGRAEAINLNRVQ